MESNSGKDIRVVQKIVLLVLVMILNIFSNSPEKIEFFADRIIYSKSDNYIIAIGNVVAKQSNIRLSSDSAIIDSNNNILRAYGDVKFVTKKVSGDSEVLYASILEYNYRTKTSRIIQGGLSSNGWYIDGSNMYKIDNDKYLFRQCKMTSCDLKDPHYRFESSKIVIFPKKKLLSKDVIFKIGNIPLFYFPYFVKNISGSRNRYSIQFGYGNYSGFYVKNKFRYYYNSLLDGNYQFHYYSRRGFLNSVFDNFSYKNILRGTFEGSFIREKKISYDTQTGSYYSSDDSTASKYYVKLHQYLNLQPYITSGLDFNFVSDENFSHNYGNSTFLTKDRKVVSTFYVSNQSKYHSITVDWYKKFVFDEKKSKYLPTEEFLPRLNIRAMMPSLYFKLPLGMRTSFLSNITHSSKNSYIPSSNIYIFAGQTYGTLSNTFIPLRQITINSSFRFSNNMTYNRLASFDTEIYVFSNRFSNIETISLYPFRIYSRNRYIRTLLYYTGLTSLGASVSNQKVLYDNKVLNVPDYTVLSIFYNTRNVNINSSAVLDSIDTQPFVDRINIIRNSISIRDNKNKFNFKFNFNYNTKIDTVINRFINPAVSIYWDLGVDKFFKKARYVNSSIRLLDFTNSTVNWSNMMHVNIFKKWYVEYINTIRISNVFDDNKSTKVFIPDHTLSIIRDLHCWESRFDITLHKGSIDESYQYEFWLVFNIKLANQNQVGVHRDSKNDLWEFRSDIKRE